MANKWYFDLPCEASVTHSMPRKTKTRKNIFRNISKAWLQRFALLSTLRDPVFRECPKITYYYGDVSWRRDSECLKQKETITLGQLQIWTRSTMQYSRIKFSRSEFEYASCQLPSVLSWQLLLGIRHHKQNKISIYSLIVKRAF